MGNSLMDKFRGSILPKILIEPPDEYRIRYFCPQCKSGLKSIRNLEGEFIICPACNYEFEAVAEYVLEPIY